MRRVRVKIFFCLRFSFGFSRFPSVSLTANNRSKNPTEQQWLINPSFVMYGRGVAKDEIKYASPRTHDFFFLCTQKKTFVNIRFWVNTHCFFPSLHVGQIKDK